MEMEKKNLAIIILAVVLAASGIGNVVLAITGGFFELAAEKKRVFKMADSGTAYTIDPIDAWDGTSNQILEQCVETLFTYDFSDWENFFPWEPLLATGYTWSGDYLTLNITLRDDVLFHDETKFNATAVEWNFNRMDYWYNLTGDLPSNEIPGYPEYIFHFADGTTPLWSDHQILGEYKFQITMSAVYIGIVELLTYTSTSMVSPTSHGWDITSTIYTGFEKGPVGTGAFVFEYYKPGKEARFHRWDRYWRTNAYIEDLVFVYFDDSTAQATATIAGDYDWQEGCPLSLIPTAQASDVVDYVNWYDLTGQLGLCFCYVEMNTKRLPLWLRKAVATAWNYTYIVDEFYANTIVQPNSPLPPGFAGYNASLPLYTMDLAAARAIMAANDPGNFSGLDPLDDAVWEAKAAAWPDDSPYTIRWWVYAPSAGYAAIELTARDFFSKIGVRTRPVVTEWQVFIDNFKSDPNWLDAWLACWCPDYLNPINMLAPIMHPASLMAHGQLDDSYLNELLENATVEPDEGKFIDYIDKIQTRYMNLYPTIPFSFDKLDYLVKEGWQDVFYWPGRSVNFYWAYFEEEA
jgi:peptide/nickel transport system substrate-binding protein